MYENIYSYRLAKQQYFEEFIELYGPYRFFLTLTFQHLISDDYGRLIADTFWRRTNKKIFELLSQRMPVESINGIAVLERASIRKDGEGARRNPHFHFLIKDHVVLLRDDADAICQLQSASWKVTRNLKTESGLALVSDMDSGVHVRPVFNSHVNGYLAKEAWAMLWEPKDRLFFLDKQGIIAATEMPANNMFNSVPCKF